MLQGGLPQFRQPELHSAEVSSALADVTVGPALGVSRAQFSGLGFGLSEVSGHWCLLQFR